MSFCKKIIQRIHFSMKNLAFLLWISINRTVLMIFPLLAEAFLYQIICDCGQSKQELNCIGLRNFLRDIVASLYFGLGRIYMRG